MPVASAPSGAAAAVARAALRSAPPYAAVAACARGLARCRCTSRAFSRCRGGRCSASRHAGAGRSAAALRQRRRFCAAAPVRPPALRAGCVAAGLLRSAVKQRRSAAGSGSAVLCGARAALTGSAGGFRAQHKALRCRRAARRAAPAKAGATQRRCSSRCAPSAVATRRQAPLRCTMTQATTQRCSLGRFRPPAARLQLLPQSAGRAASPAAIACLGGAGVSARCWSPTTVWHLQPCGVRRCGAAPERVQAAQRAQLRGQFAARCAQVRESKAWCSRRTLACTFAAQNRWWPPAASAVRTPPPPWISARCCALRDVDATPRPQPCA